MVMLMAIKAEMSHVVTSRVRRETRLLGIRRGMVSGFAKRRFRLPFALAGDKVVVDGHIGGFGGGEREDVRQEGLRGLPDGLGLVELLGDGV